MRGEDGRLVSWGKLSKDCEKEMPVRDGFHGWSKVVDVVVVVVVVVVRQNPAKSGLQSATTTTTTTTTTTSSKLSRFCFARNF